MNEKKTLGQSIVEWWQENGKAVKAGIVCGIAGIAYGFIKGTVTVSNMMLNGDMTVVRPANIDYDSDSGLTEENCDDPELMDLVENEGVEENS